MTFSKILKNRLIFTCKNLALVFKISWEVKRSYFKQNASTLIMAIWRCSRLQKWLGYLARMQCSAGVHVTNCSVLSRSYWFFSYRAEIQSLHSFHLILIFHCCWTRIFLFSSFLSPILFYYTGIMFSFLLVLHFHFFPVVGLLSFSRNYGSFCCAYGANLL